MAITSELVTTQTVYIHKETTNQSFIDMYYFLKQTGRKNCTFFLVLYDRGLAGIDPRDKTLSVSMKQRVLRECCVNYWYFLREVVRIPAEGATGSGARYKLHRGNLAMNFLFVMNYNMFVEMPRQHGKTVAAECRYLWCYQFGTTNSEIMFLHKDHNGSKKNLRGLKAIRDNLPDYLQMTAATGIDGKRLKVPNTIETIMHPINKNRIVTFASARSEAYADNLGRGNTQPLQYYDEFAFMPYNKTVYLAATPAYSRASQNAKEHGAPYGILITTTPGDLLTGPGEFAYMVRNDATPWNERYYDLTYKELESLRMSNKRSPFFLVSYTYQQLGSGEDYFERMCVELLRDWAKIRREVLLEWATASTNCPFKTEDLDMIEKFCREPIRTVFFGRSLQYQFKIYKDFDLRNPPIIGVDVSGALYQDSSAITIIDSKTTEVLATLNCNYIPTDDLADVIYTIVSNYMPNAIINIERNGGFGVSVVQRLCKTSVKKNLYYEIKDKVIEETFDGFRAKKRTAKVKVYGTDSTKEVRARLIEILYDRVALHKDKVIAPILLEEMKAMEVKKNGKVEHSDKTHDDQVFSWLMALRVWYDGTQLAERYGMQKSTIQTDKNVDIEDLSIDDAIDDTREVDISDTFDDNTSQIIAEQIDYLTKSGSAKLGIDVVKQKISTREREMQQIAADPLLRKAYAEKYHLDLSETSIGVFGDQANLTTLPDELFDVETYDTTIDPFDIDDINGPKDNIVGNLAGMWRRL